MTTSAKITKNDTSSLKRTRSTTSIHATGLGLDFESQSTPDPKQEGVRLSNLCDHDIDMLAHFDMYSAYDLFQRGLRLAGADKGCLGWKADAATPYQWISYGEVDKRATAFGAGLLALGLTAENTTRVGVYSQNRPEYVIVDQAVVRYSMCSVPLYDTLGTESGTHIINQAELSCIICDTNDKVKKLLVKRNDTPGLTKLIVFEPINEESRTKAKDEGIEIMQMSEVEELGKQNPTELVLPKPDDLYIICYTSGTTGPPKGAMVSHRNLITNLGGCIIIWDKFGLGLSNDDRHISYLPLAHAYERICQALCISQGAMIGFFQGDVRKLMDDIKELQPTFFPCVPRLLNRIYDKVLSGVNGSRIKKMLFNMAMKSKKKDLQKGIIRNNSMWDKLVFSKIQAALGGCVRFISTGSAPLSVEVLTFLRCVLGCPVMEGYGQTECTAVATAQMIGDHEAGHVGPPLPGVRVKVVDVPEMNYFAKDNRGEVCIKGANVIRGYLKNEEKTREAIDEDGWLHSGDIGQWLPNGTLKIIDRKKHIFKLAQGEYIAPEKIENILVQSPYLAQVFVHGNSLESCLVCVAVPDPETLPDLAGKLGVAGSYELLVADPVVKKAIMTDITEIGKKNGLSSLELVKEIHLHPELFSVENGLLTPTFKSKRNELASYFSNVVKDMYEKIKAATTSKL